MVESVSNTLPNPKINVMDKVSQEQLQSPGAHSYSRNDYLPSPVFPEERRSGSGFWGFLGKVILWVAVIGAASIALRRYVPALKKVEIAQKPQADAKAWDTIKYDFARFADWVKRYSIDLVRKNKSGK